MAMAVLKAKAVLPWPAAMATSVGLHLAALFFAISETPRLSDPMIEVEVLPVRLEEPAPIPKPVLTNPVPRGADVVGRRRIAVTSRLPAGRAQSATPRPSNAESPPAEHAPEATAAPGPASAESVVVAKAASAEGAGANTGPVVAGPRVGSPKTVAPAVGDGLLAINPNDPHYQPTIPQPLRRPGVSFLSRLKFCVASDGSVDKVTVVTSSDPAFDNAVLEKARLYRFHPYFDQGRPIPFCFYREFRLSIRE